ncbi:MAG: hypothetical protein HDS69_05615 [Bacteroidales bacterium]|nr:hypothetical protein [Bacteroidales bacterium]
MKKIMLAVAAIVAVSSLSLVSCGGGDPAAKATAAVEKAMKAAKEDPTKALEIMTNLQEDIEDILKNDCKTAEDSAAVEAAVEKAAKAAMGL